MPSATWGGMQRVEKGNIDSALYTVHCIYGIRRRVPISKGRQRGEHRNETAGQTAKSESSMRDTSRVSIGAPQPRSPSEQPSARRASVEAKRRGAAEEEEVASQRQSQRAERQRRALRPARRPGRAGPAAHRVAVRREAKRCWLAAANAIPLLAVAVPPRRLHGNANTSPCPHLPPALPPPGYIPFSISNKLSG